MKKIFIPLLTVVVLVSIIFVGCMPGAPVTPPPVTPPVTPPVEPVTPPEEVEKPPVKIAIITNIAGPLKSHGDRIKEGYMAAVNMVNKTGGILGGRLIEASFYDIGISADVAKAAAIKAIEDGNVGIMEGSDLAVDLVVQREARDAGIPIVLGTGYAKALLDPRISAFYGSIHAIPYPEIIATSICKYFIREHGAKSLGFIGYDVEVSRNEYECIRNEFDRPGSPLEIYEPVWVPHGKADIEGEAVTVVAKNPDIIYAQVWGTPAEVSLFNTTHRLGWTGHITIPPDCLMEEAVAGAEKGATDRGIYAVGTYIAEDTPESRAFEKDYMEVMGCAPNAMNAVCYEMGMILLLGMDKAGTDSDLKAIVDGMYSIDWSAPRGDKVKIAPTGQVQRSFLTLVGADYGKIVLIDKIPVAPEDYELPEFPELKR